MRPAVPGPHRREAADWAGSRPRARHDLDDDAPGAQEPPCDLRYTGGVNAAIAGEVLGHVARIARVDAIQVQSVGPPAELAHRFQRPDEAGLEGIDGALDFRGGGRLLLDALEFRGDGRLDLGDRVAGADGGHDGELAGQLLAVLVGLHVLGDLLLANQRR